MKQSSISRADALKAVAAVPVVALGVASSLTAAEAADNKKQFKYQDKPGPGGAKCSGCRLFKPNKNPKKPGGCSVVHGSISPNGWCIAYVKK